MSKPVVQPLLIPAAHVRSGDLITRDAVNYSLVCEVTKADDGYRWQILGADGFQRELPICNDQVVRAWANWQLDVVAAGQVEAGDLLLFDPYHLEVVFVDELCSRRVAITGRFGPDLFSETFQADEDIYRVIRASVEPRLSDRDDDPWAGWQPRHA
jgi:hypothetical protein